MTQTTRYLSLGSGSSGNAYLFDAPGGRFMIDCGIGIRALLRRLAMFAVAPQTISAIFLTHAHADHVKCVGTFAAKHDIPVFATQDTWAGIDQNPTIRHKVEAERRHTICEDEEMQCCGLRIVPFGVPHDSKGCVGYSMIGEGFCLCLATDVGAVTPQIESHITAADHLIIESNYDAFMLDNGPYPYPLRQRIRGGEGHLSNDQAAAVVTAHHSHLHQIWLCHISENNNTHERALAAIAKAMDDNGIPADQRPPVTALNRCATTGFFDIT